MSLAKELDKLKTDKRLTDWHLSRGRISKDEQKKMLDALPDLASNVEKVTLGHANDSDSGNGSLNG